MSYRLRFNPYFKAQLKEVIAQKQWTADQLSHRQNELFLAVVRRAIRHSAFYQQRYAEYGVNLHSIQSIDDLRKLPIITKDDVRSSLDTIWNGPTWIKSTGHTSGSSGTPLMVYRDYSSIVKEGAYLWAQRALFGLHPGMKVVSLRGTLDRDERRYYDRHANCLHLSSFNLREEHATWYHNQLREFQPYAIVAYPSSVEILANFFQEKSLTLKVPYIFTSSEQVYEHQRRKVERVFNTTIVDWYGNAERSIALEQRKDGRYYELPLYSVNEYEAERVLTTGLTTSAFPLIRYQVDDVIVPGKSDHPYRISAIEGRHDDVLLLPDGTRIGRIGAVFLEIEGLELAQIHQHQPEHFTIRLVVNQQYSRQSEEKIRSALRKKAGDQVAYDLTYVPEEDIQRTSAGKFKLVINELIHRQHQPDEIVSRIS